MIGNFQNTRVPPARSFGAVTGCRLAFFSPTLFSSPPSLVRYPVHTFAIERPPPAGNGIFGVETSLAESGSAAPPTVDYIGPLAARGEKNLAKGERDKASSSH